MSVELSTPATGITIVMDTLHYILEQQQKQQHSIDIEQQQLFFLTCERWARFVPLPKDFVEKTISYTLNHILPNMDSNSVNVIQKAFCSYLISIFESACLSIPQIVSLNIGLSTNMNGPDGRKRQSSKSKKRQKERYNSATNDDHIKQATEEQLHRRIVACHAALLSWDALYQMFEQSLRISSHDNFTAQGEGPIGCICTLISACLPHIIKNQDHGDEKVVATSFVSKIMEALKLVCSNNNASVRALSFEHIPIVNATLVEKTTLSKSQTASASDLTELETCIARNLAECAIVLAERCAYPNDYFNDLSDNNNEELEMERNDVRDIIRAIANVDKEMKQVPLILLDYILQYCKEMIINPTNVTTNGIKMPFEAAVHILSSPARPLQCLAEIIPSLNGHQYLETAKSIIEKALICVSQTCEQVLAAFHQKSPMNEIFPISRLLCICLASFSPFFSSMLANSNHLNTKLLTILEKILGQFIFVAVENMKNLPELIACSSLGDTVYDIRGAMRSPGGEDHVACIALMRMVVESDQLGLSALKAVAKEKAISISSVITELSQVHNQLQKYEADRGPGVFHGCGVTPKSRRVLLRSICRFGFLASRHEPDTADTITSELYRLFHSFLATILSVEARSDIPRAALVYCICEATNDLSSFPPEFCAQLFQNDHNTTDNDILKGTQVVINAVVSGYSDFCISGEPSDDIIQVSFEIMNMFFLDN